MEARLAMSGYDGRTKGKRIRKPQSGNSNTKARWKYLSADVTDVIDRPVAKLHAKTGARRHSSMVASATKQGPTGAGSDATSPTAMQVGYDIDGDGFVDIREMRLAKFLDAMMLNRKKSVRGGTEEETTQAPTDAELLAMRQSAGRLLIAKEFVERNHARLWRYGSIFTGMNDDQAAEFIATHKNFQKLMPFLESTERNRTVRSSHQTRTCIHGEVQAGARAPSTANSSEPTRQTWIETTRKLHSPTFCSHPLPELQPRKKSVSRDVHSVGASTEKAFLPDDASTTEEVFSNIYGAIDIDGDGVVDDDEMKLHLRLKEVTKGQGNNSGDDKGSKAREFRHFQQLEGRRMMAKDFVQRNKDQMWLYDPSYKHKPVEQIVEEIAGSASFATDFNNLRAKERVVRLTSSIGVSGCMVQLPTAELPVDPSNKLEYRRVKHRTELLMARKELLKPLQQRRTRGIREEARDMGRSRSEGSIGLPRIYDAPVRLEPTGSFSVTKWKLDSA